MFMCGIHNGFIIIAFQALLARHVTRVRGSCPYRTYVNPLSRPWTVLTCWSDINGNVAGNVTLARTPTASEDEKEVGAHCVARRREERPKGRGNIFKR